MRTERFMFAQEPDGRLDDRRGDRHHVGRVGRWTTGRQHWSGNADTGIVAVLRTAVCAFAAEAGVDAPTLDNLRLAISEAVTNAVVHSYRDDDAPGQVTVTATVSDDHLRVVVIDQGLGFKPRLDSPGMGTGLPIMAAVTTTLEILAVEPRGTEVHMSFQR